MNKDENPTENPNLMSRVQHRTGDGQCVYKMGQSSQAGFVGLC